MTGVLPCILGCVGNNWAKAEPINSSTMQELFSDFQSIQFIQNMGNGAYCIVRSCLMETTNAICEQRDPTQLAEDYQSTNSQRSQDLLKKVIQRALAIFGIVLHKYLETSLLLKATRLLSRIMSFQKAGISLLVSKKSSHEILDVNCQEHWKRLHSVF